MRWGAGLHVADGRPVDASAYGRYIGHWSRMFVPALCSAAAVGAGQRVLDLATGTGDAALAVALILGTSGTVVGLDIAPAMIDVATSRLTGLSYQAVVGDAQALPFAPASFDAVVCQLGLMFFPNPAEALAECRRVMRPGGRVSVTVLAAPDRAPMWGVLADALSECLPDQTEALHMSFSLSDPQRVHQLLDSAEFHDVHVQVESRQGSIESFETYWAPIEEGTGQLPQAYMSLPASARKAVRDEVRDRLSAFEEGGRYTMSVDMLLGTAQR